MKRTAVASPESQFTQYQFAWTVGRYARIQIDYKTIRKTRFL